MIVFVVDSEGRKQKNDDNYQIVGHKIDTSSGNLTAHKFSVYILTADTDEQIRISRKLESTKGRVSNTINFFDNKNTALTYSKTWILSTDLLSNYVGSYFSNNKFHKKTFCFGGDSLTINKYGLVTGWKTCKAL